ncbi:large conductance mechanosensitive channel protein MscL [bacterium]|nr:large conductance mechanosensitive channel protein MscL [bacterium]
MRPFLDEFRKFILRGNVVDLAVGVVVGAAFSKIVDSLVADLFLPVVGVLTGGFNVAGMRTTLYGDATLKWGNFLQSVINFVIVGFCMFLVVKGMNRLHLGILRHDTPPPEPTPTEKLLTEIRDLLKAESNKTS